MIIGGGVSGVSAALTLGRARRTVLLCDAAQPRNSTVFEMHGFISRDGASPAELLQIGKNELSQYDSVTWVTSECLSAARHGDGFTIVLAGGERHVGRRLLFATGVKDVLPEIPGLAQFWGRSVFVCPYCDGWEVRDKRLAVFGAPHSGVELAQELYQWSRDVFICGFQPELSTPEQRTWLQKSGVRTTGAFIGRLAGEDGCLQQVEFVDGTRRPFDALFLSAALTQRSSLPAEIGCEMTQDQRIAIDSKGRTSVAGCFAAGDAATHVHQAVVAAASGTIAAVSINDELTQADVRAGLSDARVGN